MAPPVAGPRTPRLYTWMRARFWTRDDRASGTLVSFVVGAAVFLIGVTYLLHFAMQPPGGSRANLDQADLRATGDHALQVLLGTSGYPSTWAGSTASIDDLGANGRLGLLQQGSTSRIDTAKFDALSRGSSASASSANGYVDYQEAKSALGLSGYEFHLRGAPVISGGGDDFGVVGMKTFHVAYIGQFAGGAFSSAAVKESDTLDALPIDYDGSLATLGGDRFEDDSSFLRSYLVPQLGVSVAQTTIANGAGSNKYDFAIANATAVSPVTGDATRALAITYGGVDAVSNLGYTKSREMRAVVGVANFTDTTLTAAMTWREFVDTQGDSDDYGFVELSPNGGATWYPVTSGSIGLNRVSTDTRALAPNMTTRTISISASNCAACLGASAVQVAFHWVADGDATTGKGWIVDDIAIASPVSLSRDFEKPAYDMIIVGSAVQQNALTANEVKSAIGDFVNAYGGRILVLGGEQNVQWLQPIMHVGISGTQSGVATPDVTHPLLSVPNQLDWASYGYGGTVWDFTGGSDGALFTGVVQTQAGQDILAVSNTNAFGAYGKNGSVILTTYLPYTFTQNQMSCFFANALTYGKFRPLYFDLGPIVPTGIPVAVSTRTATIDQTNDASGIYVEIGLTMYVWNGTSTASSTALASKVPPSPPRAGSATPWPGAVALTWSAPITSGSGTLSGYDLFRGTSTGAETWLAHFGPGVTSYNDTAVVNGVTYYYNLSANATQGSWTGTSSSSIEMSATPSTTPGAPTSLSVLGAVGSTALSWGAPITNGGSVVTSYNIYRASTSSGTYALVSSVPATCTTYLDYVGAGATRWYKLSASNAVGEGANTTATSGTSISLAPAPVVTLLADSLNHRIRIGWTPVTDADIDAGRDSVTAYNIYAGNSAGLETFLTAVSSSNLSFYENSIANGTTRYYRVSANSSAGEGALSTEQSATPLGAPVAPTTLLVSPTSNVANSLTLTWVAPVTWGAGATPSGYVIYRGTNSSVLTQLAVIPANLTPSFRDDNVGAAGATRYYSVVAYSDGGFGSNTTVASGTTWSVPTAPVLATVAATCPGHCLQVTWAAAVSGLSVTNYTVYRSTVSGAEAAFTGNSVGTAITMANNGLSAGTRYYYKVTAWNAAGESLMSNEVSGISL